MTLNVICLAEMQMQRNQCIAERLQVAVCRCGSALVSINVAALHRARLVPGRVTVRRFESVRTVLVFNRLSRSTHLVLPPVESEYAMGL